MLDRDALKAVAGVQVGGGADPAGLALRAAWGWGLEQNPRKDPGPSGPPPPPLPHKTIVLHAGPAIIVVVCACPRLQGDSFDPTSLTLVYGWGAKGAFATKAEAKAAFLEALKQVRPANRQSMPADVPCGLCRDGGPPCA